MDSDLRIAHKTLSIYNSLLIQPFEFDSKRQLVSLAQSKLKRLMFWLATLNAYCVTFYKIFTFFKTIHNRRSGQGEQVAEVHFSIHFVLVSGYICIMFRIIVIYLVYPELIISMFNWCSDNAKKYHSGEKGLRVTIFRLLMIGQVGLNAFFLLLYVFTGHISPQFMQASVSEEYKSAGVTLGLALVELYGFVYVISLGCFVLFTQLLFFACIFDRYERSILRLRWMSNVPFKVVRRELKLCRHNQLEIQIFNEVYAGIVYASKIMCFAMVIPGLSFAIRHHVTKPVTSVASSFYGLFPSVYFIFLCDKGIKIPEKGEMVKRLAEAKLARTNRIGYYIPMQSREMRQRIRSIPPLGIEQQHFGYLERESVPKFLDFVVSSVCSVLISSK